MAFVELRKKGKLSRYNVHVVYRINQKLGKGVFRFTKKGADFLHANFPQLDLYKPFRVFLDRDNGNLAFISDEKGEFNITASKKEQYTIFNTDITSEIDKDSYYFIQPSKEYTFILVSVESGRASQIPTPQSEVTQPRIVEDKQLKDNTVVEAPKPVKATKPAKAAKVAKTAEVVEATKPVEAPKPAETAEVTKPAEMVKPVEVIKVIKPAEVAKAVEVVEDVKPVEDLKPAKATKVYKVKAKDGHKTEVQTEPETHLDKRKKKSKK